MTDIATLTREESIALDDCEARIERGLSTFFETGEALMKVRDERLYRATHGTFETYLRERWNISDSRARQLMIAAATVTTVTVEGLPAPANEGQARELSRVPESDRADVWRETVERTEGKPTAAAIREVSEEQRKRAAEQRDARAVLSRAVDLIAPVNRPVGHIDVWIKQLGPYDEELSALVARATEAISVLDQVIEGAGDQ